MKKFNTRSANGIAGGNVKHLNDSLVSDILDSEYLDLLRLIAEIIDMIAVGDNVYLVLGSTKDRSALTLTIKGDAEVQPVYAGSLLGLSRGVKLLLDDVE